MNLTSRSGGEITYIKENLDLLSDSEVFTTDIPSRSDLINMVSTMAILNETGSSSASEELCVSKKNEVEDEEDNESEKRGKLKGKAVLVQESPRKPYSASNIKALILERCQERKMEAQKKFPLIFKQKPGVIKN
ncbi:hypothetical protein ZOSMA_47G00540 [Zostera marina]|uniref:Uncharacterized protein n=1 Tax=Zostera marina TaxID=29655 RepID=A0A0K9NZW3_ZOSMR|nr:hypothetical protein ZOSMA_47G00540 [Zostera marina]